MGDEEPQVQVPTEPVEVPSQAEFDANLLRQSLVANRTQYAEAKLKLHMSRAGIKGLDLGHPKQNNEAVLATRKVTEELQRLLAEGPIPDHATELEVATAAEMPRPAPDAAA